MTDCQKRSSSDVQPEDQIDPEVNEDRCRDLLLAVIRMAVWDSTQTNWERASDALSFFMVGDLPFYTDLLLMDASAFRRHLLAEMFSNEPSDEVSLEQKLQFRLNHMRWFFSPVDLFGKVL